MGAEPPLVLPAGSAEVSGDGKAMENASESGQLTKKGRKKKTVSWPEESKLREYFYFELDETERGEPCSFPVCPPSPPWCPQAFGGDAVVPFPPGSQCQQDQGFWGSGQAGDADGSPRL